MDGGDGGLVWRCTPGKKFKQFDKLFDLVMLNAKLFDWLNNVAKQNSVCQTKAMYLPNKKCLPNKNNICQTKQVFAKQSEYLPNYLRFPKEFVKLFGI